MSFEFDFFINSNKKWWCHVDDDTYVNVVALLNLLRQYRHQYDWYIGKTSVTDPMKILNPDSPQTKVSYLFATGGAGFCISRGLGLKMVPYAFGGKFASMCNRLRVPDDCTIGFIINIYLHQNLTTPGLFWSHLDYLPRIGLSQLQQQVTFGYSSQNPSNVVNVPGFSIIHDPSRFLSTHCYLFPSHADYCPKTHQHSTQ
jgi:fringe protein